MTDEAKPRYKLEPFNILGFGRKRARGKYARFNRRMLAATIDSLLLLVFLPLANLFSPVRTDLLTHYALDPKDPDAARNFLIFVFSNQAFMQSWISNFLVQIIIWCVYSAICLHFWSATPGKIILRMKVVDAKTEGSITDMQVFLRSFGYIVSSVIFGLGFVWIGLNKKHRAWHDYLGDTVVINLPLIPWKKAAPAPQPAPEPSPMTDTPHETAPD